MSSSRPDLAVRRIEVNSNHALRSFSPTLTNRSTAADGTCDPLLDLPVTRELLNHYRVTAEAARCDLAVLQVKQECVQAELLDAQTRLASKEASVKELKAEVESYKENNARQASIISSLRERVQETEEESGALASSKTRAEITIQVLRKENQEFKENIQELEAKLRQYITEMEETQQQISSNERKHRDFLEKVALSLNVNCGGKEDTEEFLTSQVSKIKCCPITHRSLCCAVFSVFSKEMDSVLLAKQSLEWERRVLQERLEASQRVCEASKQELGNFEKHSSQLEGSLKSSICEAKAAQGLLQTFKEQLVALLSHGDVAFQPTEEAIKERIRDLCIREESKKMEVSQLEDKVSRLMDQLEKLSELHEAGLHQAKQAEKQLKDLQARQQQLEGNLVSLDVLQDILSLDKQKYLKFLDHLSEKMKLDNVTAEVGFDMRLDAILARAEQLVKLEGNAVVENKTLAHSLQRKIKVQKEKLESKELHMELLRKKIAQMEEEKQTRTALAVERDEANLTVRKLQKKVERLQMQLSAALESHTGLKAKLSDTNELKIKTLEQIKAIGELNRSVEKLEKTKEKANKKLLSLKSELDLTAHEAKEEKERAQSMLEAVTSELRTLKHTLEEVAKREKQLLDFREVISRLLGLNVNNLALPDYEIVKRLERLIQTHHPRAVSCLCLENSLHQGFVAGYNEARQTIDTSPKQLSASPIRSFKSTSS
nr:PREDICTED: coiled-coil domain-containing protein 170 [Latimeria chalumnae]|eukprot:XP_014354036.1 PREDICTED: coiled-coil domain-containing protein 170 [Latimeria chalumnae]